MMERLRAFLSYILSFRRHENHWRFEDYPVRIRNQRHHGTDASVPPFCAQIINWWTVSGFGDTPVAAKDDLRQKFNVYKQSNDTIPRPGCLVPIQFADSSVVESNPDIYSKFIVDVLGFSPDDPVFVSDQSSLFDFGSVSSDVHLFDRTREVFGVDVSDITDGNLASIFKRIQDSG